MDAIPVARFTIRVARQACALFCCAHLVQRSRIASTTRAERNGPSVVHVPSAASVASCTKPSLSRRSPVDRCISRAPPLLERESTTSTILLGASTRLVLLGRAPGERVAITINSSPTLILPANFPTTRNCRTRETPCSRSAPAKASFSASVRSRRSNAHVNIQILLGVSRGSRGEARLGRMGR